MQVIVGDQEVDAAILLWALFNGARRSTVVGAREEISIEHAATLVSGHPHFDFDSVYGRVIGMSIDPLMRVVQPAAIKRFDKANGGRGTFARALALALETAMLPPLSLEEQQP